MMQKDGNPLLSKREVAILNGVRHIKNLMIQLNFFSTRRFTLAKSALGNNTISHPHKNIQLQPYYDNAHVNYL